MKIGGGACAYVSKAESGKTLHKGGRVKSSSCSRRLDLLIHERRWHWHVWHTIFTQVIVFSKHIFSLVSFCLCFNFMFFFISLYLFLSFYVFNIFFVIRVCICDCILICICICICIHIFDMCDTPLWLKTWLKCFSQCVEGAVIYDTVKAWWWSDIIICHICQNICLMIIDRMEPGFNSNHIRTQDIYERFRFSKTFLFYQNMKLFKTESDTGESTFLQF